MHCIFVGILKALLKLWFDPAYANNPSSFYYLIDEVDRRLREILPPEFVQRRARSIAEHLSYWKASELKFFFFYYSVPILEGLLPALYFEHNKLLLSGIFLHCQSSISEEILNNASRPINEFLVRFERLYGLRNMSCNLHLLCDGLYSAVHSVTFSPTSISTSARSSDPYCSPSSPTTCGWV